MNWAKYVIYFLYLFHRICFFVLNYYNIILYLLYFLNLILKFSGNIKNENQIKHNHYYSI